MFNLTPHRARVRAMIDAGMSHERIAEKVGFTGPARTFRRILIRHGLIDKPLPQKEEQARG